MRNAIGPAMVTVLKIATPVAAGAVGLWLATSFPEIYRAICGG